ncbi:MAG: hypothetical protein JJE27_09160, partial [Thermoleophilia bacterium]|nr:hypothetical protein [Thermoleophilia bacterium]
MPDAKANGRRAGGTGSKSSGKKPANTRSRKTSGVSRDGAGSADGAGHADGEQQLMTAEQVAERAGVSVGTLKRWIKAGAIPGFSGEWTTAATAHARIVAQLRRGGQPLEDIVRAAEDGRLALGTADSLFAPEGRTYTLEEASAAAGIEPALAERLWISQGFSTESLHHVTEMDVEALKRVAEVLDAGLPLGALLQVIRVAAKSFSDIADAEARLFRMFVHEPLLEQGGTGEEISQVMGQMLERVLPHLSPMFDYMHSRFLQQYAEQVQIENVQHDMSNARGRLNVAICFVDIAGFTRYTEQEGVEKAFRQADQLRNHIETTLPDT